MYDKFYYIKKRIREKKLIYRFGGCFAGRDNRFSSLVYRKNFKAKYIGWVGHGNLGDEALFYSIRKMFLHYAVLKEPNFINIIKENVFGTEIFDFIMLGGGTLIGDEYIEELKKYQNIPTVIFGTGVKNPAFWRTIRGWQDRSEQWKDFLLRCCFIGVRGPISKIILNDWGVTNVNVIGDPVLFLGQEHIEKKQCSKLIGINIGISYSNIWGCDEESVLRKIVEISKILINNNWKIVFVPVWINDFHYIQNAVKLINSENVSIFNRFLSLNETMNLIKKCDLFIAEKLHAGILSACVYTPFIMLEYRPKCYDFMKSLDLEELNFRTDQLCVDEIIQKLEQVYTNTDTYQQHMKSKVDYYKRELLNSIPRVIEGINNWNANIF